MNGMILCRKIVYTVIFLLLHPLAAIADEKAAEKPDPLRDHVPKPGVFPPAGAGIHYEGDLVISDPVNRRGALRAVRYTPRHYFAMLPYGMVRYHGAPADIRDIPTGTHMHGRFLLPMEGEEETISVSEKLSTSILHYRHNHAILLEDDVSFYSRQGRSWKVLGFEQGGGPAPRLKLSVEPVGPEIEGGINKPALFDIDDATRVWKNRQLVSKDELTPGQTVQVNLTWGPFDSKATTDVWMDDSSLEACREIQRQRHLRYIRSRFLPGWVDAVKNYDTGGGEVTVTFFGGMDPSLYDRHPESRKPKDMQCDHHLAHLGLPPGDRVAREDSRQDRDQGPASGKQQFSGAVESQADARRVPPWLDRSRQGPVDLRPDSSRRVHRETESLERSKKLTLP